MENESTIADVSAVHEEADDAAWTVSSGADALVVNGLSKRYDDVQALDNVSLTVQRGHTIGLLGENGAGKTTFIETVIGLRKPDSGTINLMGQDVVARPREVHQKLGIQLQEMNLMPKITVSEYLTLFTGFYNDTVDVTKLVDSLGLVPYLKTSVSNLSGGWKQKLSIALALINNPELLILDEPTNGFDPIARKGVWSILEGLKRDNRTILMSTHHMEEAEHLADIIVIISKGRIVASGSAESLKASVGKNNVTLDDVFVKLYEEDR